MSYVARSSALWFNLPGCVAAYQPVRAPGPLMARYNQARGGSNKYFAAPGALPTWTAATGWTFNGSTQYLLMGGDAIVTAPPMTMVCRFAAGNVTDNDYLMSIYATGSANLFGLGAAGNVAGDPVRVISLSGATYQLVASTTGFTANSWYVGAAVISANNSRSAYINGSSKASGVTAVTVSNVNRTAIGYLYDGSAEYFFTGKIAACALYARPLSEYEVWSVYRQMAYCDVNPEWSAWGRRRQWYYLAAGGFQAAWADYSNSQIGTGVQ